MSSTNNPNFFLHLEPVQEAPDEDRQITPPERNQQIPVIVVQDWSETIQEAENIYLEDASFEDDHQLENAITRAEDRGPGDEESRTLSSTQGDDVQSDAPGDDAPQDDDVSEERVRLLEDEAEMAQSSLFFEDILADLPHRSSPRKPPRKLEDCIIEITTQCTPEDAFHGENQDAPGPGASFPITTQCTPEDAFHGENQVAPGPGASFPITTQCTPEDVFHGENQDAPGPSGSFPITTQCTGPGDVVQGENHNAPGPSGSFPIATQCTGSGDVVQGENHDAPGPSASVPLTFRSPERFNRREASSPIPIPISRSRRRLTSSTSFIVGSPQRQDHFLQRLSNSAPSIVMGEERYYCLFNGCRFWTTIFEDVRRHMIAHDRHRIWSP